MTSVPPSPIGSNIFPFLSISKVTASSSELLLSSVLNLHNRHWNRVPFVVQWISGENLRRYAEKANVALGQLVFEDCAYVWRSVHLHPGGLAMI